MTKRALISVSDKSGIIDFAKELKNLGWDIISTGGTKVALDDAGVETIAIDIDNGSFAIISRKCSSTRNRYDVDSTYCFRGKG